MIFIWLLVGYSLMGLLHIYFINALYYKNNQPPFITKFMIFLTWPLIYIVATVVLIYFVIKILNAKLDGKNKVE